MPEYLVYEDETGTAILGGGSPTAVMAKLDDSNTVGFYSEQITLSAANGFELGKTYTIYISATVSSILGTTAHTFKIRSLEDMGLIYKGTVSSIAGGQTAITIATPRSNVLDDYVGAAVIRDVTNVPSAATVQITSSSTGGVLTLDAAAPFAVAIGDIVEILATLTLPTVAAFADEILDRTDGVETGITLRQAMRVILASGAGKTSGNENNNPKFRDPADTKNRITANTDADGNRTAITLDTS